MSDTDSRPGTPDSISTYDELQTFRKIAQNYLEANWKLERRLASLQRTIGRLKIRKADAEELNQELGAQIRVLEADNAQLIARLTELENQYVDQLERNNSLKQEKADLQESSNTLAAKNEEMQLEIESAMDARHRAEQEKATQVESSNTLAAKIEEMRLEIESANDARHRAEQEKATQVESSNTLAAKIEEMQLEIESANDAKHRAEQEKATQVESLVTLTTQIEEMQLEIESANDARRQLEQEKENLEFELDESQFYKDRLRTTIDVVQEHRETAEDNMLILKLQMDKLESENEQLKREKAAQLLNNESLSAEMENMRLQFEHEKAVLEETVHNLWMEREKLTTEKDRLVTEAEQNRVDAFEEMEQLKEELAEKVDVIKTLRYENKFGSDWNDYLERQKTELESEKLKRRDAIIQKLKYEIQILEWYQKARERELKRRQVSISNESSMAQYREDESARQHNTNSVTPANQHKRNRSTLSNITNSLTAASTSKSPDKKKKKKSISNNASNNARLEPATLSIRESLQPPVNVFDPHMRVSTDVSKKASRSKQASTRMARTSSRPSFRVSSRPLRQKSLLTIEKSILSQAASKRAERVSTRAYMPSKDSFPSSNVDEEESNGEENTAEVCKEWECELKPSADDLPLVNSPAFFSNSIQIKPATLSIGEHESESNVHDDTVYGVETTDGNSSGAMLWNPTDKYNSVCPPLIDTILEEFGLTRNDLEQHPLLAGVLETFESKEILPARERLLAIDGSANAGDQSDAAAASVVEENCYNEGSIIDISNLDDLPQECALLGLRGLHCKSMNNNPPTEGHGELLRLTRKYSPQFESAKQDGTDDTTAMVVRRMYDEHSINYSIIVLSHMNGSTYKVKPSSYSINASVSMNKDSGSIRKMLYSKLDKYHASLSNNALENIEQAKISYFQEKLDGCTRTLGNADNFVPHCNLLNDEERMNPNSGIENFESILATLKEEHPPSPSPSEEEETGPNIHSTTLESVIRDSDLFELFLSLEDDCDNSETWKKITALVKDNDSIPDHLKGLFNEPDWLGIENGLRSRVVGHMLLDLIKVLSLQCWRSNYKISECDCKEELSSLELDHNLAHYHKSFNPSNFYSSDSTGYRNPYGLQNKSKRALYEALKCCLVHYMLHSRGPSPPPESQIEEGMRRDLILNYDTQVEAVLEQFGGAASITVRQFFTLKEAVLLAMDWLSRGAFRKTKQPLVKWEALAIAPMLLFETALPDIMKCTKTEYYQLNPIARARAAINAIRTLMARLSGGCSRHEHRNCKLIRAKMNSWQIQGAMEMNHRDPSKKNKNMSALYNPVDWHKEGCNGDCENECHCCHCKINAFQNGGPRPPGYTGK